MLALWESPGAPLVSVVIFHLEYLLMTSCSDDWQSFPIHPADMVTVGTVNNTVTGADSSLGYFSQLSLANVQPVLFRLQSVSNCSP